MTTIEKTCKHCNTKFSASLKEHNRGNANFCSLSCSSKHKAKQKQPNAICAYCNLEFYKSPSKLNTKNNLHFCCREHKDLAQRLDGIKEIHPSHYGTGKTRYRNIAFQNHPHKCNRCGYDKYVEILEVHHIDRNHENVSTENLEILCPTCHSEEHFKAGDAKWGN